VVEDLVHVPFSSWSWKLPQLAACSGMGQAQTSASIAQAQLRCTECSHVGRYGNKIKVNLLVLYLIKYLVLELVLIFLFNAKKHAKQCLKLVLMLKGYGIRFRSMQSDERMAAISPESKERAQFENRLAIDREIAARRAQTDAMFGPISSSYRA
jgi:hypothetical protein